MKILYVTTPFPYPLSSGSRIRAFHILRFLASKGQVTMVSDSESQADREHLQALKPLCAQVTLVDRSSFWYYRAGAKQKQSWAARIAHLLRMRPWAVQSYASESMRRAILAVRPDRFDLIVVRYAPLAQYFLSERSLRTSVCKTVVDIDDVAIRQQQHSICTMPLSYPKIRHTMDLWFLECYYRQLLQKALACFVCSELDRQYLIRKGFSRVFVIPNAIELDGQHDGVPLDQSMAPEILFCGLLSYSPNAKGIAFFAEQIFPKIRTVRPEVRLTIVGRSPPQKVLDLQHVPGVSVTGFVPFLKPYYERATICVVPLLRGAGTRIKILEAMGFRRPVISTSIGAEGLDVTDGENILLADDPQTFANRCVELLENPQRRESIALKGYQLVKEKYDLRAFNRQMEEFWNRKAP